MSVQRQAPLEMLEDDDKKWETISTDPKMPDRIAVGRPYVLKITLHGQIPKNVKIEMQNKMIRSDKLLEVKQDGDKQSATIVTAIDMTQQYSEFKFRIVANDGSFPPQDNSWHVVEVRMPPKLVDLDGKPSPQIALYPPAYTDLPSPIKLRAPGGTRHLEVMAGTTVVLRAKADRALDQAWIEYQPESALALPAAVLSFLGQTGPLQALAQAEMGAAVWGRIPAKFDNEGSVLEVSFTPWVSGGYVLHLRDKDRLVMPFSSDLRVQLDPLPEVKLVRPAASVTAHPDAKLPFKFRVTDEQFAIRTVFVEYRKRAPDHRLIGEPTRVVLYEASAWGKALPRLIDRGKSPIQLLGELGRPQPDLRLRYKQMDFDTLWSLNQFKEGDLVEIEVCADDFCDIYGYREPGKSHAIMLRIIGRSQIVQDNARKLAEIEKELKKLEEMQDKALKTTKETQQKDKMDRKSVDRFIDDDQQVQKAIQDMIGRAPDEGLRRDLKEIRDQLKLNELQGTQVARDAGKIESVLGSIAQQELAQIEPKLDDIRRELPEDAKNDAKTKKKLEQTAKLQKSVLDNLKDLNKDLDPSARMQDQREKLRNLIETQRNLQKELERMKEDRAAQRENAKTKKERDDIDKDFKKDIAKKADEQLELYQQTQKLVEELKAAKENSTDPDNAKKIEDALKVIQPEEPKAKPKELEKKQQQQTKAKEDKEPVTKQMKDVAIDLKKAPSEAEQQTLDKQDDIAKRLDRALEALDGRREDVTKQEIQKRKDAEKQIDKLEQKLKKLQQDTKKADQIKDMEERLKKKEELAKEHAQLQDEIQEMRRQLARLEEPRAANNLNDAANKMEQAKGKLENGGNPQEEQQQAMDDLKAAKANLQEAEEELARELLIRFADQLDALKKRQDAAIERSEKLHEKVMKKKSWTDPLVGTLDANIDTQNGIGDETDGLKEKIKDAKVFSNILERAKESMDKASEVMTIRKKDLAVERRYLDKGDGQLMDDEEIADEKLAQDNTLRRQKQAAKRLDNLLDALKEELAKPKKKPKQVAKNDEKKDEKNDEKKKGGVRPGDGVPAPAQLKALRAEQLDLKQRTEEFAKRHPDKAVQLNENDANELRELEDDQRRLQELFGSILPPPDLPMPKEGDQP